MWHSLHLWYSGHSSKEPHTRWSVGEKRHRVAHRRGHRYRPRSKSALHHGGRCELRTTYPRHRLQQQLETAKDVVIIGGGFIGIEFADKVNKAGDKNITVVEIMSHCLALAYDQEFCIEMEKVLESRGINIRTSSKVQEIVGNRRVEQVRLSDGAEIEADIVPLGIGAVANVDLAKKAGLRIGLTGSIAVDRTMQTSDANIYACGDCAEKISFFGGRPSPLKLASIATLEARIAGANLFGIRRENVGTVGVWSTAVGNHAFKGIAAG